MMRPNKQKRRKLQRQVAELRRQVTRLAVTQTHSQGRCMVLEELLQQRNALLQTLQRLNNGGRVSESAPQQPASSSSNADDAAAQPAAAADAAGSTTDAPASAAAALSGGVPAEHDAYDLRDLLQQLPQDQSMAAAVMAINQQLVDSVKALTCDAAAEHWVTQVKDVALLLFMHDQGQHDVAAALDFAVTEAMRWTLAVHMFNPMVMYALHDLNLITRRYESPGPQHWAAVRKSGQFTAEQRQGIASLLAVVQPRLEQLEQEKQQLLSLLEEIELQLDEQHSKAVKSEPPLSSLAAADDTSPAEAVQERSLLARRREELLQGLADNCRAWRVTTQMRGQWLVASCSSLQLARGMLAAFPFVLHGAPVMEA